MQRFFDTDGDGTLMLMCPMCGDTYLHQERVDVVCREKEDGAPKTVSVSHDGVVGVADGVGGGRRVSVAIVFAGECGHTSRLEMTQHKGWTLVEFCVVRHDV
jgi:hypothetical protein